MATIASLSVVGPDRLRGEARVVGRASAQPSAEMAAARSIGLGVYRPVFPADLSAVDEYERASNSKLAIVHWYAQWGGWLSEFRRADLEAVAARGSLPMITWEPWAGASDSDWALQTSILSGRNDAYIESWARGLAAYRERVLLRFAHEMHDQTYPWAVGVNGNTAADYIASWSHVRDIFRREGATNVEWVWNPNIIGDADRDTHMAAYASLYPGDENVDWVGLDVFNTGPGIDWGAPYWRSFTDVLSAPYAAITAVSTKPLLLPEVGCVETGGSKAAWLREALSEPVAERFPRLRAVVWFDVRKEADWDLASSPDALRAWTEAATNPLFRADATWLEALRPD